MSLPLIRMRQGRPPLGSFLRDNCRTFGHARRDTDACASRCSPTANRPQACRGPRRACQVQCPTTQNDRVDIILRFGRSAPPIDMISLPPLRTTKADHQGARRTQWHTPTRRV